MKTFWNRMGVRPAASFALLTAFSCAQAADVVEVQLLATGFNRVTNIDHVAAAGEHLYITEQVGRIRIFEEGVGVSPVAFLDIAAQVQAGHFESGLTGVAFAPNFPDDPRVFVQYFNSAGRSVISRFLLDDGNPLIADPGTELIMLEINQPNPEHNCNQLAFGPDGMLYIGCGDGGHAEAPIVDPQLLDHPLGKILRVSVDDLDPGEGYRIPPDNPFLAVPGARPETWHYGFRNPHRFSFDEATGDLWIADVGMWHWEEINLIPAGIGGGNFGWPILEGNNCWPAGTSCNPPKDLWMPLSAIPRVNGFCAVIGGLRLRDAAQPTLNGAYLYGDFCTGRLFAMRETGSGQFNTVEIGRALGHQPATFGRAADGSVLIGTYGFANGSLLKLHVVDSIFENDFEEVSFR